MSWIVTPNLITISDAETATGWITPVATSTALTLDPDVAVQGTNCVGWGLKTTNTYYFYYTGSTVNMQNQHFYAWFLTTFAKNVSTYAAGGISVLMGIGGLWSANNIARWYMDGSDTYPGGWQCYVVDCNSTPDSTGSAFAFPSSMSVIQKWGMSAIVATGGAKAGLNTWIDVMRYGRGLTIYSGSTSNPATWEALYQSDYTGSNKYGIVDKRSGVYFLQGQIQIGATGSTPTYFDDRNRIIQFESKYVSSSYYQLTITGSNTTCSFGNVIGSGSDSIAVEPIIIGGPATFFRNSTVGLGPITRSLLPPFTISPEVKRFRSYGTRISNFKEIYLGTESIPLTASQFALVGNNFSTTYPVIKNFLDTASLILDNTLVSTTGSFTTESPYAIKLIDTNSIDGTEFSVLNSFGFTSTSSSDTRSYTLTNQPLASNSKYLTVYANKTWDVVNPVWTTPITTASIRFLASQSNVVNEKYSYDTVVALSDGTKLSGSKIYVYEGLLTDSIPYSLLAASGSGLASTRILTTIYAPSGSAVNPTSSIISSSYGDFANKVYEYGYTPYVANLTVDSPIEQTVTLVDDNFITDPIQTSSLANGVGVTITEYTSSVIYPMKVIGYKSGSVAFTSGSLITGSTSGATGQVVEYLGTTDSGVVVLADGNNVKFTRNEILQSGSVSMATSSIWASESGFSGSYTWFVNCNSMGLPIVYDYLAAQMALSPISSSYNEVLIWGQSEQSQLMYGGTSGYLTERNVELQRGVWIGKIGTGTIQYMTSDEGHTYVPPVQYSFTLTGLIAGTEVRIFNANDESSIAGVESSGTSFSYQYTYVTDIPIYVQIVSLPYEIILLTGLTLSNSNQSIPVQQRIDRNYRNPV